MTEQIKNLLIKTGRKIKHVAGKHSWRYWIDKVTDHKHRTCRICGKTELVLPKKPLFFEGGGLNNNDWL